MAGKRPQADLGASGAWAGRSLWDWQRAHERGLIHRDIKPANIWLESNHQGRVKLLDFGLARGTVDEVQLTQSGAIVGTPAFMSPEQASGEKVDHRCDLFSLGVVLYRLTTGQMPFRGDSTMAILTTLASHTPKPPREVNPETSPRMSALIERLLSKDREQRPKTAKEVAEELALIEREATQPAMEQAHGAGGELPASAGWYGLHQPADAGRSPLAGGGGAVCRCWAVWLRRSWSSSATNRATRLPRSTCRQGGSVVIKDMGQAKNNTKKPPAAKENTPSRRSRWLRSRPNAPLSPTAGAAASEAARRRSWSIETASEGAVCSGSRL